jgi:hypothetical protein
VNSRQIFENQSQAAPRSARLGGTDLAQQLPGLLGTVGGLVWARRAGRHGARQVLPALIGGAGATFLVFAGAVLFFGA